MQSHVQEKNIGGLIEQTGSFFSNKYCSTMWASKINVWLKVKKKQQKTSYGKKKNKKKYFLYSWYQC